MNAYELADELENYVWMNPNNNRDYCKEVKDMLRQQANEIGSLNARLKQQADRIEELEKSSMAWYEAGKFVTQTKPLSDEEIYQLWCEADNTEVLPEMRNKDGSICWIILTFAQLLEERHGIK